jgi:hypothetical protein
MIKTHEYANNAAFSIFSNSIVTHRQHYRLWREIQMRRNKTTKLFITACRQHFRWISISEMSNSSDGNDDLVLLAAPKALYKCRFFEVRWAQTYFLYIHIPNSVYNPRKLWWDKIVIAKQIVYKLFKIFYGYSRRVPSDLGTSSNKRDTPHGYVII